MQRDLHTAVVVVVFSLAYLAGAFAITSPESGYAAVGPRFFPVLIGVGMLASGLWLGAIAWRRQRRSQPVAELEAMDWRTWAACAGALLAYIVLFQPLGFLLATPPFLIAQARIFGSRNTLRDVIAAIVLSVAVFVVFNVLLKVDLPKGVLDPWI